MGQMTSTTHGTAEVQGQVYKLALHSIQMQFQAPSQMTCPTAHSPLTGKAKAKKVKAVLKVTASQRQRWAGAWCPHSQASRDR